MRHWWSPVKDSIVVKTIGVSCGIFTRLSHRRIINTPISSETSRPVKLYYSHDITGGGLCLVFNKMTLICSWTTVALPAGLVCQKNTAYLSDEARATVSALTLSRTHLWKSPFDRWSTLLLSTDSDDVLLWNHFPWRMFNFLVLCIIKRNR